MPDSSLCCMPNSRMGVCLQKKKKINIKEKINAYCTPHTVSIYANFSIAGCTLSLSRTLELWYSSYITAHFPNGRIDRPCLCIVSSAMLYLDSVWSGMAPPLTILMGGKQPPSTLHQYTVVLYLDSVGSGICIALLPLTNLIHKYNLNSFKLHLSHQVICTISI